MTDNYLVLKHDSDTPTDLYWPFTGAADVCYGEHDDNGVYRECCMRAGLAYALKLHEQQIRGLLDAATEFTFRPDFGALNDEFSDDPEHYDVVVLAWRGPYMGEGDPDRWAILHHGHSCWSRSKSEFIFEPRPSGRDEDFATDCRFSRDEAVALVPEILREIEARRIPELRRMVEARGERQR